MMGLAGLRDTGMNRRHRQAKGPRPRRFQYGINRRTGRIFFALSVIAGWAVAPGSLGGGAFGDIPAKVYDYRVVHPVYGDIGSYTNIIEDRGDEISVRNKFRVQVKVLFAVAYEQKGENSELWRAGRIVSFEGKTRKNGKKSAVRGYADGESFIIDGKRGRVVAPANVFPNNPWSTNILTTDTLMGTSSGTLYRVKSTEGAERVIQVDGKPVKTRYFKVDGDAQYEIWFDESGVPVKFTDIGKDTTITYRLARRSVKVAPKVYNSSIVNP